jgi:hypothetical protein
MANGILCRHDVVGLVLVKELVLIDPHANVAVRDLKVGRTCLFVHV